MSKITAVPVENAQSWLTIEKDLRPMLATLDLEAKDVDSILMKVKAIFDMYCLGLGLSMNVEGKKERAVWACVKETFEATGRFYQGSTLALLWEIATREARLIRCSCGEVMRARDSEHFGGRNEPMAADRDSVP